MDTQWVLRRFDGRFNDRFNRHFDDRYHVETHGRASLRVTLITSLITNDYVGHVASLRHVGYDITSLRHIVVYLTVRFITSRNNRVVVSQIAKQ